MKINWNMRKCFFSRKWVKLTHFSFILKVFTPEKKRKNLLGSYFCKWNKDMCLNCMIIWVAIFYRNVVVCKIMGIIIMMMMMMIMMIINVAWKWLFVFESHFLLLFHKVIIHYLFSLKSYRFLTEKHFMSNDLILKELKVNN